MPTTEGVNKNSNSFWRKPNSVETNVASLVSRTTVSPSNRLTA
jgi:hypothetical protein